MKRRHTLITAAAALTFCLSATVFSATMMGCNTDATELPIGVPEFEVRFDETSSKLWVTVHPVLLPGVTLHTRVRQGQVGVLDCAAMVNDADMVRVDTTPIAGMGVGSAFEGPSIDPGTMFQDVYDNSWLAAEPSAEMIQAAIGSQYTIDICLMAGDQVIRGGEMDVRRALDRGGSGKFDTYGEPQRIESGVAYARKCIEELGPIPFFPELADGDYGTYSCLDSTPIPMTVTNEEGVTEYPEEKRDKCDNPQFIYSSCEPNAVTGRSNGPRVASRTNEQGTSWVLLCRKSQPTEGKYNDIAMVGTNPYTGKTCFFQNALYSRTDGLVVPHPADEVDSPGSPQVSETLWNGIHGGIGSGIQCAECHDSDPLIHTPWIDGAKDERGNTIIPKMGTHDGFAQGFNEAPYSLVNLEGQGWTMPKHLTSPEAAACTKCHRIGDGRWAASWMERLEGSNGLWEKLLTPWGKRFDHYYWMPTDIEGIDNETWADSEYGKALDFIQYCEDNPDNETCVWEELPTEQIADTGELPPIELEGAELAKEALKILGARVTDMDDPRCDPETGACQNRRCSECHSVSKNGLKHWRSLTTEANSKCGLDVDPETMTQQEALKAVDCLRAVPEDPDSVFAADKVGILATGARHGYFRELFRKAFDADLWLVKYIQFKQRVSMPKGTYTAISEFEHAVLLKWFDTNLTHLNDVIEDPPAPANCDDTIDTVAMGQHIEEMKFEGWGAVNRENGLFMHGCTDEEPANCFADKGDRTDLAADKATLKEVLKLEFRTSFWTRSSADGRFVGNGGGTTSGATITDMQRGLDIKIKASYDPGFFPDNSGFIFQGGGTGICNQSLLETEDEITFDEEGCIRGTNINLYQHVARGLDGDYFVINSQFTSDSGRSATKDPIANFNADSTMKFSPMIFNGQVYEQLPAVIVDSPYEGDSVLSPSGQLVISRIAGPEGNALGYSVRKVVTEKDGQNYKVNIDKEVARFCFSGAKANISYDERFFVTHQYEADGTANIVLGDFATGEVHPVTNMPTGAKALFPHFRSDGWFYFLVRSGDEEFIIGSDMAIQLLK